MDYTILVNKENLLGEDYVPEDLIVINEPTGSKLDPTYKNRLNEEVYAHFKAMQAAALEEGYEIFVDSSYREYAYQKRVFDNVALEKGLDHAMKFVAPPGGSEHQTGLAFDVCATGKPCINSGFDNTAEAKWLAANAYKYGFILRYPKGKESITGYKYESWHFRYVGKDLATKLYNGGNWITLEEHFGITSKYDY